MYIDQLLIFDIDKITVVEPLANLVSEFALKTRAFPNGSWKQILRW